MRLLTPVANRVLANNDHMYKPFTVHITIDKYNIKWVFISVLLLVILTFSNISLATNVKSRISIMLRKNRKRLNS